MTSETQQDLVIGARIVVPARELEWSFARSSGPGGQNVNKVNSKAILRWRPIEASGLRDDVKQRFLLRYQTRLTNTGELILESDEFRDQPRNIRRCLEKLSELIQAVARPPRPRKATKPSAGANRRRLADKQHRSDVKQQRQAPRGGD